MLPLVSLVVGKETESTSILERKNRERKSKRAFFFGRGREEENKTATVHVTPSQSVQQRLFQYMDRGIEVK